jgi:hypothetical protein
MRLTARVFCVLVSAFCASAGAALGSVVYVNAAATGANNGSSWANAYTSLQSALAAAGSGDEIWVAAATYKPTATTDRTVSFALKDGVGIYGGFDGTETQRSQRNPSANVTILSGDIGTSGVASDNSFHVVTSDGSVTATGVLDGFTVTAGQADGNPASNQDRGGGIWVNGGSASFAHLQLSGNFASSQGGGVRVTSASPTILNSSVVSNSVGFGGGGGGLYSGGGSSVYAQNVVFRSNQISGASTGGGGIETAGSTTLVNCEIAGNSPNGIQSNVLGGDNNVFKDSTFTANTPGYALAFFNSNGNTIANSIFWGDASGEIFNDGSSSFSAEYCDFQGGGVPGSGNINADPLFLSPPSDLRLGASSPAVDAGKNLDVPGGVVLDISGLPRFFDDPGVPDTGSGIPPIVDMGAHERVPISVTAPANQTLCTGNDAVFTVTASGQEPLTYQWRKNGSNLSNGGRISGADTASLTVSAVVTGDAGNYDVVVTDAFSQSITSTAAALTVNTTPVANASGTASICLGNGTQLTGSGGATCSWSPATGLDDASSCSPIASPTATTVYTLTVYSGSAPPCASTNAPTVTVTVNPVPAQPVITAPVSVPVGASGASASAPNHAGSTYAWTLTGGTITAGQTTHQIVFDAGSPGTTMHCTVVETSSGCASPAGSTDIQVDFLDIPPSNPFHDYVIKVALHGITAGCGGGNYCGTNAVTRAQMAVFLLKAEHSSSYAPPACKGVFADVPCPGGFAVDWVEQLFNEGITGGCGGGNYCPNNPVRRDQMAVFLLKTSQGSGYVPPPATGTIFADVPANAFAADWIEDLYNRNITGGCASNPLRYCPGSSNNRQQMAVFLVKMFNLS